MRADPFRCSARSLALAEPMHGTASTVANWILLEQPGPWGHTALLESRIPVEQARAMWRRYRDLRIRVVLIRRPSGLRQPGQYHCYLAHTGPDSPWMESLTLTSPADLLDLRLDPMADGHAPDIGRIDHGPLFLVCTNGRRDRCCAERGRPLSSALTRAFSRTVWECSHIGGDRFAGNLVCFPHGIYFGRVEPEAAEAVGRGYVEGRISLDHFRGRSCYPFDVQAAEHFVRRRFDLAGIDAIAPVDRQEEADGRVRITFLAGGRSVAIVVRARPASEPRQLTCHATRLSRPPTFEVIEAPRTP